MRLKTFSASSMSDALKMVKEHFGEEAIIVSSQKAEMGLGVQVTAAVDTETENRILERLKEQSQNQTTLIVSHRISTIRNAEKIIVINQGEIVESGTHDSLLENKGFYYDMYQQQLSEENSEEKPE